MFNIHFHQKAVQRSGKFILVLCCMMLLTLISGCRLPDTGQTWDCIDIFGEDSDYLINPPHYTKLDAAGNDVADDAPDWAMVRDDVTGLIWEVKTDDGSIHDKDNAYTWQEAKNIHIVQLNSQNFGGYNTWRLPTVKELSMLINENGDSPTINSTYFPNCSSADPHSIYWSTTPSVDPQFDAWSVDFKWGDVGKHWCPSACKLHVRAVIGREFREQWFIDNGNDTVTDLATRLMWQQDGFSAEMAWFSALENCENLVLAGYDDWRLPNRMELQSIVDHTVEEPAINTNFFPDTEFDTYAGEYWTSTTALAYEFGCKKVVAFRVGHVSSVYAYDEPSPAFVRCVRTSDLSEIRKFE